MHLICQSTVVKFKFDRASQIELVLVELLTLIKSILAGIDLSEKECFSSVSTVGFEQVNVCWVPPYQFINVKITYC